jgi:histidine ammonia-lyase
LQGKLWKLLALQALALAQAGDLRPTGIMGADYEALHDAVREVSPRLTEDRPLAEEIAALTLRLQSEELQERLLPVRPPAGVVAR